MSENAAVRCYRTVLHISFLILTRAHDFINTTFFRLYLSHYAIGHQLLVSDKRKKNFFPRNNSVLISKNNGNLFLNYHIFITEKLLVYCYHL